jgi:spore coat protein A
MGVCKQLLAVALGACLTLSAAAQTTVNLPATKDNTIFDLINGAYPSNGQGQYMFAGTNTEGNVRRALIKFDLSSIPVGSTVSSVTLTLHQSRSRASNDPASLHRLLADWGEGASDAQNEEGQGTAPAPGDATWVRRFFDTLSWNVAGGEFVSTPSATTTIGNQTTFYSWTGAGMVSDVQAWANTPSTNFGWILRGNEPSFQSAMRFDTRENPTVANRPVLSVTFTPPAGTGACCITDGTCLLATSANCASLGGTFQGEGSDCSPNPCPQPTGACCLGGSCSIVTNAQCQQQGGIWQGANTTCSPNPCSTTNTVSITAEIDNTMYQYVVGAIPLSNGQGSRMFVGGRNQASSPAPIRRALVKFDLSSIPAFATIQDASLQLYLNSTGDTVQRNVSVHQALNSWGEGASAAGGTQGNGATALAGDATWFHRFFNTTNWTTPGGEFNPTPAATTPVGTLAGTFHTWTSPDLISEVQSWVQFPATNFGWVLIADNESTNNTQRGFDTSESVTPVQRPTLTVTYSVAPTGACCLSAGACIEATNADCLNLGGTYRGDNTTCAIVSCPVTLEPFVDELPLPQVAQPVSGQSGGAAHYVMDIVELQQQFHTDLPPSRVWGYDGSYPGTTIEARRDQTVTVVWRNQLRNLEDGNLRTVHALPVDTCLHGPDVTGNTPRTVTHLHGGHVGPESDGDPDASFPPGQQSPVYIYPNIQQASTLWYHDHSLGLTRLNVYMGLAGFYLIRDSQEDALNIPRGANEIPLAIQDRSFNADGSLKHMSMWEEHFIGDFITVNGKVWPYLDVARGKYRFRVLNGSGSRAYRLSLSNGATFWQIGTDNGLLPAPVPLTELTIIPGERADIVIDFAPYTAGTQITLLNSAPVPFPGGDSQTIIPNVMKFKVGSAIGDTDPLPATLVPFTPIPESEATVTRDLVLRRAPVTSECPSHATGMWMINDLMWDDITEFPRLGSTEIWSWINRSGVTHPMHMHLVSFQILDRQDFDIVQGVVTPVGPRVPPPANEAGWKDTVAAAPNQITRVIARFENFYGLFPYHCHILEHEDHEMMRQFQVTCEPPSVGIDPLPVVACPTSVATLTVGADGDALNYVWRRAGLPLANGTLPSGALVSGANSATLSISGITASEAGQYDCVITNPCGTATTIAVSLSVPNPCCDSIDYNNDSSFFDPTDIDAFLSVFSEGPCIPPDATCNDIDFNNDGSFFDPCDIDSFLLVFSEGPCTVCGQ